jgi:hypothetical protein
MDLLEKELVSDREIGAKTFVERVDELGQGHISIGLSSASPFNANKRTNRSTDEKMSSD